MWADILSGVEDYTNVHFLNGSGTVQHRVNVKNVFSNKWPSLSYMSRLERLHTSPKPVELSQMFSTLVFIYLRLKHPFFKGTLTITLLVSTALSASTYMQEYNFFFFFKLTSITSFIPGVHLDRLYVSSWERSLLLGLRELGWKQRYSDNNQDSDDRRKHKI